MLFPATSDGATTLELVLDDDGFPVVVGIGPGAGGASSGTPLLPAAVAGGTGTPLLGEHSRGRYGRPHLRGHRAGGRAWSTRFGCLGIEVDDHRLVVDLADDDAGLQLRTEAEALPGGALRIRHTLTNLGDGDYLLDGLEVVLPVADHLVEVLDLTGRHEHERHPQRHQVTDGLWLREGRGGRPGLGAATLVAVGTPGFGFTHGDVVAVHVGWSGGSVLRVERGAAEQTTLGGGELLLPGELSLAPGVSYSTPWVYVAASTAGLDAVAAMLHTYERSLAAHPISQPVVLNVWEAVYFDHDLDRLRGIADRAARVGVERFVLDDGWFRGRRDDTGGLGDWTVDETVWPDGLTPLVEHVHGLGMEFGLWFEPEMINPDSDLYREHPDWILGAGGRVPLPHRQQQVLDLTRPEAFAHVLGQLDAVLSAHAIDYVKWDHNRDLLEAGSGRRGGAAAVHEQTLAFYALLDELRARHPGVAWESCASGGGRIDLGVLERVQRVWTSDMTDALARQQIQRWTLQLAAPEYVGAHVSAPTSHVTGRTFDLDFRAATAFFGAFGIEWDLTDASEEDLSRLAGWVALFREHRVLLHSGRVVRPESPDPAVLLHGVVAADRSEAVIAHVQLDESAHNRGVRVRVPGLDADAEYEATWLGPVDHAHTSMSAPLPKAGPTDGVVVTGGALASTGLWLPRRRPETATLVRLVSTTPAR